MTYKKLDPEFKAKWLKALRSGRYTQARSHLRGRLPRSHGKIGYCCLGVACDITDRSQWRSQTPSDNEVTSAWGWKEIHTSTNSGIPFDVIFGIDENAAPELMVRNDLGTSFNDIADWIEERL